MTTQIPLSSCLDGPITPKLWESLGMDQYLRSYPGGQNITLSQYARQVHAANFICGIGRHCLAGQPCVPVEKHDWLVLYSVQQWNFYMNSLYEAVQGAITMVRESAASAVSDFTPNDPVKWMGLTITTGVLAAIILATAGAMTLFPVASLAVVSEEAVAATAVEGEAVAAAPVQAEAGAGVAAGAAAGAGGLRRRHHKETLSTDKFAAYAKLDNDIGRLQFKLNKVISLNINSVLNSPISSDLGVYNVVKNATYLIANPNQSEIQQSAKKLAQLTMISELFKSLKMFAVVGSGPCNGDGPNGALSGNDVLSYCSEDGLLMNIVRAEGDKMKEKIPNGNLLFSKYGFETKYLISTAWSCQEKCQAHLQSSNSSQPAGAGAHAHAANSATITETANRINSDCAFSLPVCDTRLPEIRKRINNHDDVVVACREAGNLDI
ncbi:hypothetical protein MJO28_005896 [Puccinia striiformis f. sp. tritici]|uniref:DUF7872 domain-containing protein n=3 Tax=Puccinia striiformis TaxID=27350 RepID=A0A0L0US11_9BASI|nr:hypothetical protein Pst134EB_012090 [Puccinia striiformis f. sp. tritici]KAI7953349.1 hypothetical protein MJO28_005896 [Puccinia striiformis f. sp. tritici]KNE89868.1 hypothetical protein PSTG_16692 [Puccinia striiformis f. sp. tritici PST-78]POW07805.1 hypothetical protein PSTT_08016 [Puccinia striiformis]